MWKRRNGRTFYSKSTDLIEMATIYMRIDTEEAANNGPNGVTEVLGEGNTYPKDRKQAILQRLKQHLPILLGNIDSSSSRFCAQFINASTYSGAGSLVGRLYLTPSSQRYSYLLPRRM